MFAERFFLAEAGNLFGRPVEGGDAHFRIDGEDAVGDAVENGAQMLQLFAMRLQLGTIAVGRAGTFAVSVASLGRQWLRSRHHHPLFLRHSGFTADDG